MTRGRLARASPCSFCSGTFLLEFSLGVISPLRRTVLLGMDTPIRQGVTCVFQGASSSELLWNRYSALGLACILFVFAMLMARVNIVRREQIIRAGTD